MSQNASLPQSAVGGSYAGPLSFLRCPYTRDLQGVDLAVLGIPYDAPQDRTPNDLI